MRKNVSLLVGASALAVLAFYEGQWICPRVIKFMPELSLLPSAATLAILLAIMAGTLVAITSTVMCWSAFIFKFVREWQGNFKSAEFFDLGTKDNTYLPSLSIVCSSLACGFFAHFLESEQVILLITLSSVPTLLQFIEFLRTAPRSNVPDG